MTRRAAFVLAGILTLSPTAGTAQVLLGPELQVNTYTTDAQWRPSVAADPDGNFVVVWDSLGQDGDGRGVFARFHDASGAPRGSAEFRVNSWTTGNQQTPRVAATFWGEFVVVWESWGQNGPAGAIFARRYDAAGTPLGPEFQVSAPDALAQGLPVVATDVAGKFVVAWEGVQGDGSHYGVRARRYDADDMPLGTQFRVNSYTTSLQWRSALASDASGNFVVAWQSFSQDPGGSSGIYAQRYDAAGGTVGGEFRVNAHTTDYQSWPALGSSGDGKLVAVWSSRQQDGAGDGVFARRYEASGAPLGAEFQVNAYTTGNQMRSAVAVGPGGPFAVVWVDDGQDGSGGASGTIYWDEFESRRLGAIGP
jgi:hypothetical protein